MKYLKQPLALALCSPLLAATAICQTQNVSLNADRDNTMYGEDANLPVLGAPAETSNGIGPTGFSGNNNGGNERRFLVHFDVAGAVPAGSTITGVTLELNVEQVGSGSDGTETTSLHRLTADWGEGTSNAGMPGGGGAPATPGDATWNQNFFGTSPWALPGGDFAAASSATGLVNIVGLASFSGASAVADVQAWLDNPTSNFGWILVPDSPDAGDSARYSTREGSVPPSLSIDYELPDPCDPSNDDAFENNETCSGAPVLTPGSYSLFATKTDWDFFSVDLADGETLDVSVLGTTPGVDFGGVIWDSLDAGCGTGSGVPLVLSATGPSLSMTYFNKTGATQTVLYEVYVPTAQTPDCGTYDMDVSITPALGSSFCTGVPNSTGQIADLYATGNPDALANDITLQVCAGPPSEFLFIIGSYGMADPGVIPGGLFIGELCVGAGSPIARFVDTNSTGNPTGATQSLGQFDVDGNYAVYIDMSQLPVNPIAGMNADFATEGMDFHFQAFYRDGSGVANFSSGLTIPWVTFP